MKSKARKSGVENERVKKRKTEMTSKKGQRTALQSVMFRQDSFLLRPDACMDTIVCMDAHQTNAITNVINFTFFDWKILQLLT